MEADVNGVKESYLLITGFAHFVGCGHQHVSKGSGQMAFHREPFLLHCTVLNISCFLVISSLLYDSIIIMIFHMRQ